MTATLICLRPRAPRLRARRRVDELAVVRSRSRGAARECTPLCGPDCAGSHVLAWGDDWGETHCRQCAEAATAAARCRVGRALSVDAASVSAAGLAVAGRMEPALRQAGRQQPDAGAARSRARRRGAAADLPGAAARRAARPPGTRPHVAPSGRNVGVGCAANTPATLGMHRRTDGLPLHARRHGTPSRQSGCAASTAASASTPERASAPFHSGITVGHLPACCRFPRAEAVRGPRLLARAQQAKRPVPEALRRTQEPPPGTEQFHVPRRQSRSRSLRGRRQRRSQPTSLPLWHWKVRWSTEARQLIGPAGARVPDNDPHPATAHRGHPDREAVSRDPRLGPTTLAGLKAWLDSKEFAGGGGR